MYDRLLGFTFASLIAGFLALIGLMLVTANWFIADSNDHVGLLGVPFIAGASVMRIRALLCRAMGEIRDMKEELANLMNSMFDAGREVGRAEGEVRHLR